MLSNGYICVYFIWKNTKLLLFKNDLVQIDVNVSPNEETVWLTLNQISELFGRDKSVISRHISKIFEEEELDEEQVVAKNATTGPDGKIYNYDIYNLDVIISVGYRVKSKNGIVFRKWANNVLKEFLLKGYCISNRALVSKDNYLTLYNKVLSLDEEVNKLKKEIAKIKPKSEIFYKGQYFESQIFIKFFKNIFNTVFSNGFCDVFSFIFNFFFAVTHRN